MPNENKYGSRPKLILLVDDDDTHRYALGKHLSQSGFEVIDAKSGTETVNQALRHRPDAILLDIRLPDMDGFKVCEQLKANPDTKHTPVIFHSAIYDVADARASAQAVGAYAFLSYPIDVNHLVNVLLGAMVRETINVRGPV